MELLLILAGSILFFFMFMRNRELQREAFEASARSARYEARLESFVKDVNDYRIRQGLPPYRKHTVLYGQRPANNWHSADHTRRHGKHQFVRGPQP